MEFDEFSLKFFNLVTSNLNKSYCDEELYEGEGVEPLATEELACFLTGMLLPLLAVFIMGMWLFE